MLAIIGFGSHVQKNILPALGRLGYEAKYIVVRNIEIINGSKYSHNLTTNLETVLQDQTVSTIYIATPISTHFHFCKISIEAKKNVICEKPIVTESNDLEILIDMAIENKVTINQVVMYKYHRVFHYLKDLIKKDGFGRLNSFVTRFEIPHLGSSNIRYKPELGGGALFDVGFYPISLTTTLFGGMQLFTSTKIYKDSYKVDLEGWATFKKDNLYGKCYWAIGKEYENYLELTFEKAILKINRFYSKPHDLDLIMEIKYNSGDYESLSISADDQFYNMFDNYLNRTHIQRTEIDETRNIVSNIMNINEYQ